MPTARDVVIMGPPGAGKGTQAQRLAERLGVPHISTGDLFRANLRDATLLGIEARGYMDAGELVPDQVTTAMVRARLDEADAGHGFILDGFPRTVAQADSLSRILRDRDADLDVVIELVVADDLLVERLLARGRSDDSEDVIRRRQQVYWDDTAPLLEYYRDLVVAVDAVGPVADVTDRMSALLTVATVPAGG
jgi:adenylate kinase